MKKKHIVIGPLSLGIILLVLYLFGVTLPFLAGFFIGYGALYYLFFTMKKKGAPKFWKNLKGQDKLYLILLFGLIGLAISLMMFAKIAEIPFFIGGEPVIAAPLEATIQTIPAAFGGGP